MVPQTNQESLLSLLDFRNKTLLTKWFKQQNFFSQSGALGVQDQDPGSISPSWAICFKDLLIYFLFMCMCVNLHALCALLYLGVCGRGYRILWNGL